jgi:enamine deaminase RidA (YjgF/YER057c/UK114 family)
MSKRALLPDGWPRPRGYAHGVAARGTIVSVAGQIGAGPDGAIVTDDFAGQVRQALENIVAVLAAGGAEPRHVVRLTWYLRDRDEYVARQRDVGAAFREVIGDYDIAMSAVQVAALIDPAAKVEIEATAVVPDGV